MDNQTNPLNLPVSKKVPTIMHIDLNSCFASVEQQARPSLRDKPVAVAAYTSPNGCIISPSIEAKQSGVKVGMRVKEGKMLCPSLIILPPDPWKYRQIHLALKNLLLEYSDDVTPKSIDEFVINLEGYPALSKGMLVVGQEIKVRIKNEVGDWLRVNIGIGPNRFLAKTAAGLHKPDGLDIIDHRNLYEVFSALKLTDLCGISQRLAARLNLVGITSVTQFLDANVATLKQAFLSICGYYWYLRLRGWEIDDIDFGRKSFGNSYSLAQPYSKEEDLCPLLVKLVEKCTIRIRRQGYSTGGVHLSITYRGGNFWHKSLKLHKRLVDSRDIYKEIFRLFRHCPYHDPVANLAVSCFDLETESQNQLFLFAKLENKRNLVKAIDEINNRWGEYSVAPALMVNLNDKIVDRISFGGVKELEGLITEQEAE